MNGRMLKKDVGGAILVLQQRAHTNLCTRPGTALTALSAESVSASGCLHFRYGKATLWDSGLLGSTCILLLGFKSTGPLIAELTGVRRH